MNKPSFSPTPDSYNSKNGMLTKIWGPPLWHFLHTVSFNYPVEPTQENKEHYMQFILQLQHVLPCGKCRENLKKNFETLPLRMSDMESRHTFSMYIYTLHETVNTMLNKQSGLTYEDVRDRYEMFRANCLTTPGEKTKKKKKDEQEKERIEKEKALHKEQGCTNSLYHVKSRCIMNIVPDATQTRKKATLQIHSKCNFRRCSSKTKRNKGKGRAVL